jgi:hypothetical protein
VRREVVQDHPDLLDPPRVDPFLCQAVRRRRIICTPSRAVSIQSTTSRSSRSTRVRPRADRPDRVAFLAHHACGAALSVQTFCANFLCKLSGSSQAAHKPLVQSTRMERAYRKREGRGWPGAEEVRSGRRGTKRRPDSPCRDVSCRLAGLPGGRRRESEPAVGDGRGRVRPAGGVFRLALGGVGAAAGRPA